jgi:iron complex transport system ATP-binding protein
MGPLELSAHDLKVRAAGRYLLAGVSLQLRPGSMTALLGPNGAGKTTLLRALAGLLSPSSGRVELGGRHLAALDCRAIAREVAYLPQHCDTRFHLCVEQAVALGRYPRLGAFGTLGAGDRLAVDRAIDEVGLTDFRHRTLPTLSGGERQRALLARALAQEAPVLLLDEPLSALDVGRQLELLDLLGRLNRQGRTVLAALHDLRPALEYFPEAALLHGGALTARGPSVDVVSGPALSAALGVELVANGGPGLRLVRGER